MAKEIKNGYSPNHVYANKFPAMGYCPLAGAMYANSYKGVKLLLEAGADPNIIFTGPLIFNDSNYNTLNTQPPCALSAAVKAVYRRGCNPYNTLNTNPLAYAICRNADIKIIKLLMAYGANLNRAHNPFSEDYSLTPLMLAHAMGNKKAIELLMLVGAEYTASFPD
jgi:ankyrin repeat protein